MGLRLTVLAVIASLAAPGPTARAPRFSLSVATASPGDHIVVRLTRAPRAIHRPLRLYLVSAQFAAEVHTRSDVRLSFIGSLAATTGRALRVTVPSLAAGTYLLAYCRCTPAAGTDVTVLRSPALHTETPPESATCATTQPNGTAPGGAPPLSFHGSRALAAWIPRDGVLKSSPDGTLFDKMVWIAEPGRRNLRVRYRRLDVLAPAVSAEAIAGTLSGYNGPSWASRLYLDRGCWEIRGVAGDATVTLVLRVAGP